MGVVDTGCDDERGGYFLSPSIRCSSSRLRACSPRFVRPDSLSRAHKKIPKAATDPLVHTWVSAVGVWGDVQGGYKNASKAVLFRSIYSQPYLRLDHCK